jgi:hypothetical protein
MHKGKISEEYFHRFYKHVGYLRDFRLPTRSRLELRSSELLRSKYTSRSHMQGSGLEDGTYTVPRNAGTELPLLAA